MFTKTEPSELYGIIVDSFTIIPSIVKDTLARKKVALFS